MITFIIILMMFISTCLHCVNPNQGKLLFCFGLQKHVTCFVDSDFLPCPECGRSEYSHEYEEKLVDALNKSQSVLEQAQKLKRERRTCIRRICVFLVTYVNQKKNLSPSRQLAQIDLHSWNISTGMRSRSCCGCFFS